jgi:dTDP-4-dehydrorhamnose 3,5-epimerase
MIFTPAPVQDAWIIDLEPRRDARGFFARTFCEQEFSSHGLNVHWVQVNHSLTVQAGMLRGMHYQVKPHSEIKLVRCIRGAAHDIIVDLRPDSPTYRGWFGIDLTEEQPRWLYVPEGFGHGFLTLSDKVEMEYMISAPYTPESERGFRFNDPYFSLSWPRSVEAMSPKDASWPDFEPATGHPLPLTAR